MCTKTPKVAPTKEKKPQYLRNPFLDGLAFGSNAGRDSLRIDRADPNAPPKAGVGDFLRDAITQRTPAPGLVVPSAQLGFGGGRRGSVQRF